MAERPPKLAEFGWGDIVEAAEFSHRSARTCSLPCTPRGATLCWCDVVEAEIAIVAHVFSMLWWAPMCALRACHKVTEEAFDMWTAQPIASAELSWVRVPVPQRNRCLRFLALHCRNTRYLVVSETAHFGERFLLRLVCGMRLLESLDVGMSPFGGSFPEPQRLLDRLAKYCPRLQHLAISFRHQAGSQRQTLEVRSLAWLGRRLLSLDLGAVSVRVVGGSRTLAACCPQLERLSAQLCQQHGQPLDMVNPSDLSRGCPRLQDLDLAPVDWDDTVLERFVAEAPHLRDLALRHIVPGASPGLLAPLALPGLGVDLVSLHLALHARTDPARAAAWLEVVAEMRSLRSLCLDYAAPLRLSAIAGTLCRSGEAAGDEDGGAHCGLVAFTVHGCHGVDDDAVCLLASAFPWLEQLRLFPDSWREVGEVSDTALKMLVERLPHLRTLAVGSHISLLGEAPAVRTPRLRSLCLFSPLGDNACGVLGAWRCLRHLWLGPHKLMQHGVGSESTISDQGLELLARGCPELLDLTVASRLVTDAGVEAVLSACRELRRLRLGGQGITDATLQLLGRLVQPRLERFALWFSGVTADGVRQAEEEMPWMYFDIEVLSPA